MGNLSGMRRLAPDPADITEVSEVHKLALGKLGKPLADLL